MDIKSKWAALIALVTVAITVVANVAAAAGVALDFTAITALIEKANTTVLLILDAVAVGVVALMPKWQELLDTFKNPQE